MRAAPAILARATWSGESRQSWPSAGIELLPVTLSHVPCALFPGVLRPSLCSGNTRVAVAPGSVNFWCQAEAAP
jgi:hypothetical protein